MNLEIEGNKVKEIRERLLHLNSFFVKHSLNSDQCIFIEKELEDFEKSLNEIEKTLVDGKK